MQIVFYGCGKLFTGDRKVVDALIALESKLSVVTSRLQILELKGETSFHLASFQEVGQTVS